MIVLCSDLEVFKLSYSLAMDIFKVSRTFPKEEKYSLTDQVIRASRSIAANIAEG
jgi:four helix bundle protein